MVLPKTKLMIHHMRTQWQCIRICTELGTTPCFSFSPKWINDLHCLFFYINLRIIAESCGIIIWFLCCQYINIKLRVCICIPNAKQMLDNAVYQTDTFVILHNASLPMQPMILKFLLNINHRFRYTLLSYHWYNHSQWPELLLNGRRPHCLSNTHQC